MHNMNLVKLKNTKAVISTSGNGYRNVRICIPNEWVDELGITNDNKNLIMLFDGKKIIIRKEGYSNHE